MDPISDSQAYLNQAISAAQSNTTTALWCMAGLMLVLGYVIYRK